METKRIILPTKEFVNATPTDLSIRVSLDNNNELLREGDVDVVINLATLFNTERQACDAYKIYGKIKMIFRNMYTGDTTYHALARNLYLNGDGTNSLTQGTLPYNEFAFLRNDVLREINTPGSGSTLGYFNQNILLVGYTGHTTIYPMEAPYQNWNIYLTYVYSGNTNFPMNYTLSGGTNYRFTSGDGILFNVTDNGNYYSFTSPVEHGMNQGEYLILSGNTYYIDSIGNEIYNSDLYVVNVLKNQFVSGTTLNNVILGKRCLDI